MSYHVEELEKFSKARKTDQDARFQMGRKYQLLTPRVQEVVAICRGMTDRPPRDTRFKLWRVKKMGSVIEVLHERYYGEGVYGVCSRIQFPASWLDMPRDEIKAEMTLTQQKITDFDDGQEGYPAVPGPPQPDTDPVEDFLDDLME